MPLDEFNPFRPNCRIFQEIVHRYAWCVTSILATLTIRRSSHTMSTPMLQVFPFAFSHVGLFIKHSDVTDVNHVTFWPRDLWDNFNMKVTHISNEKKGVSKYSHNLKTLPPFF